MSDAEVIDPELTAERLRGLVASASSIREVIASGNTSDEAKDTIRRNCDHIGIACMYEDVINSNHDLSDFWLAQKEGHQFLSERS